jgi:uncharacterized protein (TIGR02001 family)
MVLRAMVAPQCGQETLSRRNIAMKKVLLSMVIGMMAGMVVAQDAVTVKEQPSDVSVSGDVGLYSAYVWRGFIVNNRMVAQPSVTAAKGPFSLNVWGNLDVAEADGDHTEVDYTAAYTLPLNTEAVSVDVGMIFYTYPGNASDVPATEEAFVKATFNNIILTPVASLYYDIDEADGWYGNLAVSQGVEISDAMKAEIGGSMGYATGHDIHYYTFDTVSHSAFCDFNVHVSAEYALTEKMSVGALLQYTYLNYEVATPAGQNTGIVWGGINLSYKFL